MIKNFKTINKLAVFQDFDWDKEVRGSNGEILEFKDINIFYGRNYSGKTTLSRIIRAMETGALSENYESPSFSVPFVNGIAITQNTLDGHGKTIRVFNEDFVRENIRFIIDPDDNVEPFAILGEGNNKIEEEIEALQTVLGSSEEGKETALYAKRLETRAEYRNAKDEHMAAADALRRQLTDKATDRKIGIKYKADRFGDQNYNIQKLKADIEDVLSDDYSSLTDAQVAEHETLIAERTLQSTSKFYAQRLHLEDFIKSADSLINRKISKSDKIDDLVQDAILNRWVNEGRVHHKGKHENCAFCGNQISAGRWEKLERHFDEESSKLEQDIDTLINKIEVEKQSKETFLSINTSLFYSTFHGRLETISSALKEAVDGYSNSLDRLITQLELKKSNLLKPQTFQEPKDTSAALLAVWNEYERVRAESEAFTKSLSKEQSEAKSALRLHEVSNYLSTIGYQAQLADIERKKAALDKIEIKGKDISTEISQKEALIAEKKRQLNDEEKGAIKVNEYLNHFFGHPFISLEAIPGEEGKKIRFEVRRSGKKAYHLSEGECSLLAFCYFMAKLDDIDTKGSKPIIWIDDPISSLDSNHVFFIYSLISAEIVASEKFEQLFVSTHNLDFLKYLRRLSGQYLESTGKKRNYDKSYFLVSRKGQRSIIKLMPKHLREYATEFNYLFHQIHKCSKMDDLNDSNYQTFYNFGNNARKFLEIYLYYRHPDQGMTEDTLKRFFGDERVPAILTDRINNEYSHLSGVFERGASPVEVPEMLTAARKIIERLSIDNEQFTSLLKSIGETAEGER